MRSMATVYYCAAAHIPAATEDDLNRYLDPAERMRYERMQAMVATRFLHGRKMAKQAIAEFLTLPLPNVRFEYSENGKPYIQGHRHCHFNISHCETAIAVVVSNTNIGIDVESIERHISHPPKKALMLPYTAQWVHAQSEPRAKAKTFTLLWTLMESQVKLADSSIFRAVKRLAIALERKEGRQLARVATDVSPYGSGCQWLAFEGPVHAADQKEKPPAKDIVALAFYEHPRCLVYQWVDRGPNILLEPEWLAHSERCDA